MVERRGEKSLIHVLFNYKAFLHYFAGAELVPLAFYGLCLEYRN